MQQQNNNVERIGTNCIAITLPWGDKLLSFQWKNVAYVKLANIAENLGIQYEKQLDKLKAHAALRDELLKVSPNDIGIADHFRESHRDREFWAISLKGMYSWLCGISASRIASNGNQEAAEKLIMYQRECMTVLENYWSYGVAYNIRFVIDNALTELHEKGVLDIQPVEDRDIQTAGLGMLYELLLESEVITEGHVQLEDHLHHSETKGLDPVIELIRMLPRPRNPGVLLVQRDAVRMLGMMEQSQASMYLRKAYVSNLLVLLANHIPGIREQVNILEGSDKTMVAESALWQVIGRYTRGFVESVFNRDELLDGDIHDMLQVAVSRLNK